jgi:hypothetical protein
LKFKREMYEELQIQCKSMSYLDNRVESLLKDQIKRMEMDDQEHLEYMAKRREYLEKLKLQLNDNCKLNTELASRYRDLKYDIYNVKLNILRDMEKKLGTFNNLKDKRQLKSLQERMHYALKDYFNYKSNR